MRPLLSVIVLAALGASWLWLRFNAEPPTRGNVFPHDVLYYFHPMLEEMGRRFASGELPLWTENGCAGRPVLAAMQPAALYPLNWLSAWVSAAKLLEFASLAHALLGGVAAALCLRRVGAPPVWAAALGVVFVHACILGQSFWPPEVAVLAWWPVVLLCADAALDEDRVGRWGIALTLATGLQLLAGFPQLSFYGAVMVLLWVLARSLGRVRKAPAEAGKRLARVFLLALLGVGLAGAQLGASAELLVDSARSEPFTAEDAHYLQRQARAASIAARAVDPGTVPRSFELSSAAPGYLGIATFVLALTGLFAGRRDPRAWAFAGLALSALLLADGYQGVAAPVYHAIAGLPGLGHFRAPERLLFVAFASWIGLAGLGAAAWSRAVRSSAEEKQGAQRAMGAFMAAVAVGVALLGPQPVLGRVVAVLVFGALPLWLPARVGWSAALRRAAVPVAAGLAVLDLVLATGPAGSFRSLPEDWSTTPHADGATLLRATDLARIAAVRPDRVELVAARGAPMLRPLGTPLAGGTERLACYETLLPGAWPLLSQTAKARDFPSAQASNLRLDRYRNVYAMASVGLVGELEVESRERFRTERDQHANAFRAGSALRDGPPAGTRLRWHRVDALPRAYLVSRFRVEEDVQAALDRVTADGFDPHREVVLDADPGLPAGSAPLARAVPAEILERIPERVRVRTHSRVPAILVLTDSHAPGWRAWLDDEEVDVLRANGLFRAVAVPPGEHVVRFDYAPRGLQAGAAAALASAAILAGWAFMSRRRGGRSGAAS